MFRTIKERLVDGEKVILDKETLETRLEAIEHKTLHTKLRELQANDVVNVKKSQRKGRPQGGSRWVYKGRFLKVMSNYQGPITWDNPISNLDRFDEPHDLAIDVKTNTLIAYART